MNIFRFLARSAPVWLVASQRKKVVSTTKGAYTVYSGRNPNSKCMFFIFCLGHKTCASLSSLFCFFHSTQTTHIVNYIPLRSIVRNNSDANNTNCTVPAPTGQRGNSHWRQNYYWGHDERKAREEFQQNRKQTAGGAMSRFVNMCCPGWPGTNSKSRQQNCVVLSTNFYKSNISMLKFEW